MEIDLDAIRAARLETESANAEDNGDAPPKPHTLKFRGKTFPLTGAYPWALVQGLTLGDEAAFAIGLKQLFPPEIWPEVLELGLENEEAIALGIAAAALFGIGDVGESSASGEPSTDTSSRSRPTSNGATASTSAKPSGGRRRRRSAGSEPSSTGSRSTPPT